MVGCRQGDAVFRYELIKFGLDDCVSTAKRALGCKPFSERDPTVQFGNYMLKPRNSRLKDELLGVDWPTHWFAPAIRRENADGQWRFQIKLLRAALLASCGVDTRGTLCSH
jgi:hypothetical protein